MSVSLSSVYEQTESLREIQQKFEQAIKNQAGFQSGIAQIVEQATNLTMSESYRLVVVLSKYLNNNSSVIKKYTALYLLKKLLLTALHHYYIFVSVRALMWIFNTARFQARKNQYERARMYIKQLSLKGNGDEVIQQRQCYKLLKLVDQFLPWTSQNIPIHINAEFQFPSTFARSYDQLNPKRQINSYDHFSSQDYKIFQQNFNKNKSQNKEVIKQLCQFISLQVKSLIDQQKYKSQLLKQVVRTGDSYCIRTIVSQICGLIEDNGKIFYCLKVLEFLVNLGEVQFIQLVKLYVVPALLGYLLPINFIQGKRLSQVPLTCSLSEQKCIIDFICIWARITEKVGLSTKFYTQTIKAIQATQKNILNVQQKHLTEFSTKVIDMQKLNNIKRPHIQNQSIEQQLIKVLNLKQSRQGESQRITPQFQLRTSVINQLSQFKESQISIDVKSSDQSASYAAIFGAPLQKDPNSNRNIVTPSKPILQLGSSQQQFMTFKDVGNNSKQQIKFGESPLKQPLKISKGQNESSFMEFEASNMSKFSEYEVKRSKQGQSNLQNSGGLLKQQFKGNSNIQKSIQSKSESVVYFNRSDEFHSENSAAEPQNNQPINQSKSSKFQISSAKSFKTQPLNDQSCTTYKFDSSNIGKSSASNSEIQNFGQEDLNFPESVPKPTFGFKAKDQYGSQRILESSSSIKKQNSLSKILKQNVIGKKRNLMDSQSSQIKDLSGGRHINESIRFSEGSEINDKDNQAKQFKKSGNFSPYAQYYPSNKPTQQHNNGIQIRKSPPIQKLNSESPHQLKKSVSDKLIQSNQNLIRMHQLSSENRSKPPTPQSKTSKVTSQAKKKPIILDQFANDKLLDLEKQLGRALEEKNRKQQQLRKKQTQYKILKSKSIPYMGRKVQTLKKQDEIINILLTQKNKEDYATKLDYIKPVKYQNKLSDYFLENQAKGKYIPSSEPYDRIFVKQILGSRCLLLSNQQFELGYNYSQIQNQVSFYLTFFKIFDAINVQVHENSIILEKSVGLNLENQPAGYQLKIKRKVKGVKLAKKQPTFNEAIVHNSLNNYRFPQIEIKVTNQSGQQLVFRTVIPSKPVQIKNEIIEGLVDKKVLRSEALPLSQQFMKNHKQKIEKYFPQNMGLVGGWTLLGYSFPLNIFEKMENQYFKFKITKGKTVEFQLFNDPKSYLAQALTCIFYAKSK